MNETNTTITKRSTIPALFVKRDVVAAILVICALVLTFGIANAADTHYVPDNYAKIQWAVDNATAGDTIIVRDSTYTENVVVNKSLTIQSENGPANCIVSASSSSDYVFYVTEDYVTISGFTVEKCNGYEFCRNISLQ